MLNDSDWDVRRNAVQALGKTANELVDRNVVQEIADKISWRLTDAGIVAVEAFNALLQAANHLTVLEVDELKVIDPIADVTKKKMKVISREIPKVIIYGLLVLISASISQVIIDIVSDKFNEYLQGRELYVILLFLALLSFIFLVVFWLMKLLESKSEI